MAKKGYSRRGLFGTVHHYDAKGKEIGHSSPGLFGSTNHYDKNGKPEELDDLMPWSKAVQAECK